MKRTFYILTFILFSFSRDRIVPEISAQLSRQSITQKSKNIPESGFTIDSCIKRTVKKRIGKKIDTWKDGTPLYSNVIIKKLYENDTLTFSKNEKNNLRNVFNSYYSLKGDTVSISGGFGLPRGEGFWLRIINGKAKLLHTLSSRGISPDYSNTEKGNAMPRIIVECSESKIILSETPDPKKKGNIFGYVEFKTADYYVCHLSEDGKEILPRTKQRKEMKIYFMSGFYEF